MKPEQEKIAKLRAFNSSYFHGKIFFGDDGSQNMFVYQPTLDTLELKKTKGLIMFLAGNQRGYIFLNLNQYILLSYIA